MGDTDLTRLLQKAEKYCADIDELNKDDDAKKEECTVTQSALDVLNLLLKQKVTTQILVDTKAGKRVKRLTKCTDEKVQKAAQKIVDEWKSQVSKQNTDSQKDSSTKSKSSSKSTDTVDQKVTDKAQSKDTPGRTPTPLKNEGPTRLSTTGDTRRDGVAKKFLEALKLVGEEEVYNPVAVAARIERALFAHFGSFNEQYKSKVKSLLFNLKDPKNPDLRKRVLSGEVDGGKFITMSPEEMQSAEQRKEVEKIREELCQEAQRGIDQKEGTTDQFQCGKCRQRKTKYFQMQTRSADEPMTTFVTCMVCGNRWKFC
eukprot:TRINITY_DN22022_c0_g1_i11.p1 TRINITY_DN22022_c0_g1~~TRINITY_DN22022_c0_g1_i11.p1  ORF type:complete len:314 (-),score=58.00 TRINITY_DN22022_c0_g1_i11:244-1185(-)